METKKIKFIAVFICFHLVTLVANAQIGVVTDLQKLHAKIDSCSANLSRSRGPVIGVSAYQHGEGGSSVPGTYINAVIKAGGTPVVIPVTDNVGVISHILNEVDGLVLVGGEDVNPSFYKEQPAAELEKVDSIRDVYDLTLIKLATDRKLPILGICRGEQIINVAFGGTLYQDLPTQNSSTVQHRQTLPREVGTHNVSVVSGSELARILGPGNFMVNTFHHQAIKDLAPGFTVTAQADDGVVEGIESLKKLNILAVQWHPEGLVNGGDTVMLNIFKDLVHRATTYKKQERK